MPRGLPDFGIYRAKTITASLDDMAELAVRLGSIVSYDRRGEVVDFDDFEEPVIKWDIELGADGSAIKHTSEFVKSGSQSLELLTTNVDEDKVYMVKGYQVLTSKKLGAEISFSIKSTNCYLQMYLSYRDGAIQHLSGIQVDPSLKKLYTYDAGGEWEEVADIGELQVGGFVFHTVKFVVDMDTDLYERVLFNLNEYDVSDKSFQIITPETGIYIEHYVYSQNRAALGSSIWLDDFIFTQDEP